MKQKGFSICVISVIHERRTLEKRFYFVSFIIPGYISLGILDKTSKPISGEVILAKLEGLGKKPCNVY